MFWKYFIKNNLKIIFKRSEMVFFENYGVQKAICWGAGRNTPIKERKIELRYFGPDVEWPSPVERRK